MLTSWLAFEDDVARGHRRRAARLARHLRRRHRRPIARRDPTDRPAHQRGDGPRDSHYDRTRARQSAGRASRGARCRACRGVAQAQRLAAEPRTPPPAPHHSRLGPADPRGNRRRMGARRRAPAAENRLRDRERFAVCSTNPPGGPSASKTSSRRWSPSSRWSISMSISISLRSAASVEARAPKRSSMRRTKRSSTFTSTRVSIAHRYAPRAATGRSASASPTAVAASSPRPPHDGFRLDRIDRGSHTRRRREGHRAFQSRRWNADRVASPTMIRVAVVDDHPVFRQGLAHAVEVAEGLELGVCPGLGRGLRPAGRHPRSRHPRPRTARDARRGRGPARVRTRARVLVVSAEGSQTDVLDAIAAGASGYLTKSAEPDEITAAVRIVANGETYVSPTLAAYLLRVAKQDRPCGPAHADRSRTGDPRARRRRRARRRHRRAALHLGADRPLAPRPDPRQDRPPAPRRPHAARGRTGHRLP